MADYYGSPTANKKYLNFRERLMNEFQPTDFVRVVNTDDEDFAWQYLRETDEKVSFEGTTVPMKYTLRKPPIVRTLPPGMSIVIPGSEAYIMIENLYKKMVSKQKVADNPKMEKGVARSFGFEDSTQQTYWIDKILVGIENPSFGVPEATTPDLGEIDKDLGLEDMDEFPTARATRGRARQKS